MRVAGFLTLAHTFRGTNGYTKPDCHDLLLDFRYSNKIEGLSANLDRCLWDRFKTSDPLDASWFRCLTRRPSGTSGFTPNSLKAVLSRVVGDANHMAILHAIGGKVCGKEDLLIPYDLLRFHMLNVCKVNMLMGSETSIHKYSIIQQLILDDRSEGKDDVLWHLMNVVGTFHARHMLKETHTFISAALDAWLLRKIEPTLTSSIDDAFQQYWHSIVKHMDTQFIRDVDEDVGQTLLELFGEVYSSNLRLDTADLIKKLHGVRSRIHRLDNLLSEN